MKRVLPIIIAIVLLVSLLLFVKLNSSTKQKRISKPVITFQPYASAILAFSRPVTQNGLYTIPVVINAGEKQVTGVELEIMYDPRIVTDFSIAVAKNGFFTSPVIFPSRQQPSSRVRIFTIGVQPGNAGQTGSGVVANVILKAQKGQLVKISFGGNTAISAMGQSRSILRTTTGTAFISQ